MGFFKALIGTLIFIVAIVILWQPITVVFDATQSMRDNAANTTQYGTNSHGQVVAVGKADAGGDITNALLGGTAFFAVIGFIIWLVLRAPVESDVEYDTGEPRRF